MSWHHEDYISFFAAIGGMVSAGAAAYAAIQSRNSAKDSHQQQMETARFERERHFYELLRSDAARANETVRALDSSDWSYAQAANITYAIESARNRVESAIPLMSSEQILQLKAYFKEQLSHEIKSEMKDILGMPDALYKPKYGWMESRELVEIWLINKEFFGFDHLYDSDLDDE